MSQAKSLSRFPRPNVAVDIAVLTVAPLYESLPDVGTLSVLVMDPAETGPRVLPGRFIRKEHTIAETIAEILTMKLDLDAPEAVSPTLLRVFDDPHRDQRGWTLSIAHAVSLAPDRAWSPHAQTVPVGPDGDLATGERLGYDHNEIVREAVASVRARYETAPDPDGLLEPPFTLSQLRHLHEAVFGEKLRKDTFNRRMREQLERVYDDQGAPLMSTRTVGRPAQLFRRPRGRRPMFRSPSALPRH